MAKRIAVKETRFEPSEWRKKAAEYLEKARLTNDTVLRAQFSELAARYLEIAENFEHQEADSQWPKSARIN